MSLETDLLLDRQRLKRRLAFWRILAVLAICGALAVALPLTQIKRKSRKHRIKT
jgi:anti-sigma-K factor RskA